MEDFVPEDVNPREEDEVIDEKQKPGADSNINGGGFINHLISNLVTAKSDGDDEENQSIQAEKETSNGGTAAGKVEEKSGGLLGQIISNLVVPLSPKTGKVGSFDGASENKSEEEKGSGGGVDQSKGEKTEDGEGGGGGIIDNIVSQLPTSLPDNAAPTSDEATILIHIVQD